jgi:hypothetical protein
MINVDVCPVEDESEALLLMLHHLRLAAAYFEATPQNLTCRFLGEHFSQPAILSWIEAMEKLYPNDDGETAK